MIPQGGGDAGPERCSAAARARGDSPAGTAPHARRWVLIEHLGPWARTPMDTPPFLGPLGVQLAKSAAAHAAKVLLIRRPGRVEPRRHKVWFVVDTLTGLSTSGTWDSEADLLALARHLGDVNGPMAGEAPDLVLVCTHGTRDACCAIRGRPVAGLLSRQRPDEVWECSHLGGHRFAATLLLLPDGACYGVLDQAHAARVVAGHREGRPSPNQLRGLTRLSPPEQVAHVWAMRHHPEAAGGILVGGAVAIDESHARVVFELPGGETEWVDVERVDLEPAALSCGKGPQARAEYRVIEGTEREDP